MATRDDLERLDDEELDLDDAELLEDELPEEVAARILGFEYTAYPKAAGIFINQRADVEGVIYKGYSSEAKILYEWLDAATLRIYLENPEVGDSGEIIVHF